MFLFGSARAPYLSSQSRLTSLFIAVPPRVFMRRFQSTQLLRDSAKFMEVRHYELQKICKTRWWSELTSVRSFLRNKKAIEALHMKNQTPCPEKIAKLDWDFLEVLLETMERSATATAAMEADKHPTIGYVLGMVVFLKKKLKNLTDTGNPGVRATAEDMLEHLNQR